jgi:hypothetical protein
MIAFIIMIICHGTIIIIFNICNIIIQLLSMIITTITIYYEYYHYYFTNEVYQISLCVF